MTRVVVFGTFDFPHEGHAAMMREARSLAPDVYLIVSVARDSAVRRVKGVAAVHNERERCLLVQAFCHPDQVVLGHETDYIAHIRELAPDIIALGYDQSGEYVDTLERDLSAAGLSPQIRKLQPYKPEVYKSSKLRPK